MLIDLSEKEAHLFVQFQKNYNTFVTLHDSGVLNIKNGKAILNFDSNGTLCDIECNIKVYKKGADIIPVLVLHN